MNITYQEKQELNALSKEVFGASSRWQKLVNDGYRKLITKDVSEEVPATKEGEEPTSRIVQTPVLRADGAHQFETVRHTTKSIKEYMLERKETLNKIRAEIKRQQDEAKAKKELEAHTQEVHRLAQGSAV
jgi:hypothetical protein